MLSSNTSFLVRRDEEEFMADSKIRDGIRVEKTNLFVHIGILFDDNKRELLGTLDYVNVETRSQLHSVQ